MRLYSFERAKTVEQRDYRIGTTLYQLPVPASLKRTITNKRYVFKKRMAQRSPRRGDLATSFMLECYNPHDHVIRLSLTIRPVSTEHKIHFQRLIQLTPGFCRVRIAVEEISSAVDLRSPFSVEMIPNDDQDGTTLYFGVMDFLQEVPVAKEKSKKAMN